jgi:hypothetical protein
MYKDHEMIFYTTLLNLFKYNILMGFFRRRQPLHHSMRFIMPDPKTKLKFDQRLKPKGIVRRIFECIFRRQKHNKLQ